MLTIKNLVDEVMLRAQRFDVALELDVQTVQTSVNKARREVQSTTMGLYPERYGRIAVLNASAAEEVTSFATTNRRTGKKVRVYKIALPEDCIDVYDVVMHYSTGDLTAESVEVETQIAYLLTTTQTLNGLNGLAPNTYRIKFTDESPSQISWSYTVNGTIMLKTFLKTNTEAQNTFVVGVGETIASTAINASPNTGFTYINFVSVATEIDYDNDTRPTFNYEARRLDRRELFTLQRHIWNGATIHSPVYGVDKQITEDRPYLYFAGTDYVKDGEERNLVDDVTNSGFKIEVWYIAALNELEQVPEDNPTLTPDREIRIPYEFEELIIINSLIDCFQKIDAPQAMESIATEKEQLTALVSEYYEMSRGRRGMLPTNEGLL
jgi:hypothetical protein